MLTLTANDIYRDGRGVGKINGKVVFIENLLIGETAECEIIKEEKNYYTAKAVNILNPSPYRTKPDCPVYDKCGGCDYRHASYECELEMKLVALRAAYRRSGIALPDDIEILSSESERRNKATFHVSRRGGISIGFYDKGSHSLVSAKDCRTVSDEMKKTASLLSAWLESNTSVTDISVRETADGKEASLLLESKSFNIDLQSLITALKNSGITTAGVKCGGKYKVLFGKGYITDTLCGNKLNISPNAFYQINPAQAQKAYLAALDFAKVNKDTVLLDVCCGIGSIALAAAGRVKTVYGIEIVKEAVENAKANAALNGITNARFFCADAKDGLTRLKADGIIPDTAVVDPPRAGLDAGCIKALTDFNLRKIAYISCEPSTQARDVKIFLENGHTLEKICAVDFFKRTRHTECVVLLSKVQ